MFIFFFYKEYSIRIFRSMIKNNDNKLDELYKDKP